MVGPSLSPLRAEPVGTETGRTGVLVLHGAPVERALGSVRQRRDELDPIGYFEGGELAAAISQDRLRREAVVMGYHDGTHPFPVSWVGDGEYGRLRDTGTSGENGLDVLG